VPLSGVLVLVEAKVSLNLPAVLDSGNCGFAENFKPNKYVE